ncbi:hypothetical protein Chor_000549 [Crotalus horridus]
MPASSSGRLLEAVNYLHNLGIVHRDLKIKDTFLRTYTEAIQNYNGNDEKSRAVDDVQHSLSCCGVQNYTNWNTSPYFSEHGFPPSCCMNASDCNSMDLRNITIAPTKINQKGCYDLVTSFMETNMGIIAGVAFGIAFSQVCYFIALKCVWPSFREGLWRGAGLKLFINS